MTEPKVVWNFTGTDAEEFRLWSDNTLEQYTLEEGWAETITHAWQVTTELARLAAELEKEKREHAKTLSLANDRDVTAQARVRELEGAYERERELHASTIRESMKRAARVRELEDRLAAYTPLPGYNVIHSENTRLREALARLASSQCFYMPFMFKAGDPGHEEIKLRQKFAEAALKEKP